MIPNKRILLSPEEKTEEIITKLLETLGDDTWSKNAISTLISKKDIIGICHSGEYDKEYVYLYNDNEFNGKEITLNQFYNQQHFDNTTKVSFDLEVNVVKKLKELADYSMISISELLSNTFYKSDLYKEIK